MRSVRAPGGDWERDRSCEFAVASPSSNSLDVIIEGSTKFITFSMTCKSNTVEPGIQVYSK